MMTDVPLRLYCNKCLNETRHGVLRTYEEISTDEVAEWQIVQCAGCESISFYKERKIESELGWEIIEVSIYPQRLYRKPKHFVDAPANLDQVYRETINAFNDTSLVFCAGGLRALVEGICAQQGVTDGPSRDWSTGEFRRNGSGQVIRGDSLGCLIEGLAERRILTDRQATALHQHRYLGNEALHELKAPEKPTLEKAINIIETIMETLYNIQAQADELMEIRERARNLDTTQIH